MRPLLDDGTGVSASAGLWLGGWTASILLHGLVLASLAWIMDGARAVPTERALRVEAVLVHELPTQAEAPPAQSADGAQVLGERAPSRIERRAPAIVERQPTITTRAPVERRRSERPIVEAALAPGVVSRSARTVEIEEPTVVARAGVESRRRVVSTSLLTTESRELRQAVTHAPGATIVDRATSARIAEVGDGPAARSVRTAATRARDEAVASRSSGTRETATPQRSVLVAGRPRGPVGHATRGESLRSVERLGSPAIAEARDDGSRRVVSPPRPRIQPITPPAGEPHRRIETNGSAIRSVATPSRAQGSEPARRPVVSAVERVETSDRTEPVVRDRSGAQGTVVPKAALPTRTDYGWLAEELRRRVAAMKRYPYAARASHLEGRVVLRAVVRHDGQLAEVRVERSSGHEILDREAAELVRRVFPLALAHPLGRTHVTVQVPILYSLR